MKRGKQDVNELTHVTTQDIMACEESCAASPRYANGMLAHAKLLVTKKRLLPQQQADTSSKRRRNKSARLRTISDRLGVRPSLQDLHGSPAGGGAIWGIACACGL